MNIPERVLIIGTPISAVNEASCTAFIDENIEAIKGQYICVSNVHTTVMAYEDENYKSVQSGSILTVPDGKPLSVLGKRQNMDIGRVTGLFLMRHYLLDSKQKPFRHFFYGNTENNLNLLMDSLKSSCPSVNIVGYKHSVFRDLTSDEKEELIQQINDTNPDFVWVSLGAPRQEIFCAEMKNKINGLMIGVGGAFNVLAGTVPDAPDWMKQAGLEWFFRLQKEPIRLFRRYFEYNSKFIMLVFIEKIKCILRKQRSG